MPSKTVLIIWLVATPEFDSAGGSMTSVVRNMAHLTPEDRGAIAAYLKALPGG